MARGRLWTEEEDHYVGVNRARLRLETIAAELSRSPYAVYQRRYSPTRDEYLTSGLAARETGYSAQWLTTMARQRRIRAHRVPGGRWWLFKRGDLPYKATAGSAAGEPRARPSTHG